MAYLVFCALCHKAVTDQDSNQLSLLDVVEQVQVEVREKLIGGGLVPMPAQLATFWTRSDYNVPEKIHARLRLLGPSNALVGSAAFEVDLEAKPNYRAVLKLQGLPVSDSGRFWFLVESENADDTWSERGRFPLDVTINERLNTPDSAVQA